MIILFWLMTLRLVTLEQKRQKSSPRGQKRQQTKAPKIIAKGQKRQQTKAPISQDQPNVRGAFIRSP
jgi:hypothetical protein